MAVLAGHRALDGADGSAGHLDHGVWADFVVWLKVTVGPGEIAV